MLMARLQVTLYTQTTPGPRHFVHYAQTVLLQLLYMHVYVCAVVNHIFAQLTILQPFFHHYREIV